MLSPSVLLTTVLVVILAYIVRHLLPKSTRNKSSSSSSTIAFFHPYCHAGGGGERVLWIAVRACLDSDPSIRCMIYSGDWTVSPLTIMSSVHARFGIEIDLRRVSFIFLRLRFLVDSITYPRFTLIGQSLGSIALVGEALVRFRPHVYIDTMGYAFTYPIVKYLIGCPVVSYTHFPTISVDMLTVVSQNRTAFNNAGIITRFKVLRQAKLWYYKWFSRLYSWCGNHADLVMTNSSWTHDHISQLWGLRKDKLSILYPPCNTDKFRGLMKTSRRKSWIMSVAQFRPEKNHSLQVHVMAHLVKSHPEILERFPDVKLVIVGGCRDESDLNRARALEHLAASLGIAEYVQVLVNIPHDDLGRLLGTCMVGIHTMIDEHFGISVVEGLAAGLIMVAHNSAGPKCDIIVPYNGQATGYLAETVEEYVVCIVTILVMTEIERQRIQEAASAHVCTFSDSVFAKTWIANLDKLHLFRTGTM